jgi:N-acetylglucosaminyldiphosphoundecaprenol N-acetyl-beta-D-mannosaminyltransferase
LRGHPGRFHPDDEAVILAAIQEAHPDLLVVGLPTPLQQQWVVDNRDRLAAVPIVMTGGSYLDHVAERLEWYPRWVLRARIGWLYRLAQDPRRLWHRYTIELVQFGLLLARQLTAQRHHSSTKNDHGLPNVRKQDGH